LWLACNMHTALFLTSPGPSDHAPAHPAPRHERRYMQARCRREAVVLRYQRIHTCHLLFLRSLPPFAQRCHGSADLHSLARRSSPVRDPTHHPVARLAEVSAVWAYQLHPLGLEAGVLQHLHRRVGGWQAVPDQRLAFPWKVVELALSLANGVSDGLRGGGLARAEGLSRGVGKGGSPWPAGCDGWPGSRRRSQC